MTAVREELHHLLVQHLPLIFSGLRSLRNAVRNFHLEFRAFRVARFARRAQIIGLEFDHFGRRLGRKLRAKRHPYGKHLKIHPMTGPRYFELPFALSCLPEGSGGQFLDISSPVLFSLFVANRCPSATVMMINPDADDLRTSRELADLLALQNIFTECIDLGKLNTQGSKYNCIWSISVIEHINDSYDDQKAILWMYDLLKPGGRLILTFPVDKRYWVEYRDEDPYNLGRIPSDKGFFYQRFYTPETIESRLLMHLPRVKVTFTWYGERTNGWSNGYYEPRRRQLGLAFCIDDAKLMTDNYQQYLTWESMPGAGVCGMLIEKPE